MKSLPFLLVFTLLPCTAATALQAPAPQVQAAYTTPAALDDVMTVYEGLNRIISNMYGDEPQEEYIQLKRRHTVSGRIVRHSLSARSFWFP